MNALSSDDLKEVAKFGPRGKLPDKKTDAEGWNKTWNRYLEWRYNPKQTSNTKATPDRFLPLFEIYENPLTSQTYLAQSRDMSAVLLKMQVGITDFIGDQWGSFALGWLSLDSEERRKHVLKGLVHLCDALNLERERVFCPESTNAFLERDSGRGFLDLMTTFFPPQPDSKTQAKRDQPTLLFHPQHDRAMGFDQPCPVGRDPAIWDMIRNNNQCARSDFLCRMALYIFCNVMDIELPPIEVRKLGAGRKERREFYSRLPDSINSIDGFKKSVVDSMEEMQNKAVWGCTTCRRVPYCNKECQTRDWKFGDPPHKTICGKPISLPPPSPAVPLRAFEQAISSSGKDVYAIPPPDRGFIRSSDLVCQIVNLQDQCPKLKELAYIVMKGGAHASFICLYQDTWTAAYFRVFRNHAFRNGDPKAVAVMYKFFSQEVDEDMFPLHLLLLQLCREFDIKPKRLTELARDVPVRELSKRDRDKFVAEMDCILTPD
ncbi:hypothetical protein FRC01_001011 [Tulasnella sp. 417]|nr:hypothetical protein FRC01_001011 [Tulasnella sp. 417]